MLKCYQFSTRWAVSKTKPFVLAVHTISPAPLVSLSHWINNTTVVGQNIALK